MMNRSKLISKLLPFLVIFLIGSIVAFTWFLQQPSNKITVPFPTLVQTVEALGSNSATLTEKANGVLELETKDAIYISQVPPNSQMIANLLESNNIIYSYSSSSEYGPLILGGVLFLLVIGALALQRKAQGGISLGNKMKSSLTKPTQLPSISLDDIGGLQDEMKEEILQTLSILRQPEQSLKMGIKAPKGILFYGPPGTGKTLLAQAIAHELGATFFSSSGSAFNEMFIGVGASRVRNLFANARKQGPAVIFIDEVDALAGKRKPHGGEEGEKTLTELLVQLDGGHANDGILFIAATNRKDMLDDAFLRPGRIDFTFQVPLPDTKGRREIIEIHTKGKNLSDDVRNSLDELAESTSGFSGAEIASLFANAGRLALRNGRDSLVKSDLDSALDRTILGSSSRALQDANVKRRVAIHEAGHALLSAVTNPGSIRKATIVPRGQALGYVAPIAKELQLSTTSELLDRVAMILAGGVAERIYLGEHSIGVSGDVQQAKQIIEQMVDTGLLQDEFTLTFNKEDKEAKMQVLFENALERSKTIIRTHEDQFQGLVEALLKKETLEGTEIEEIVNQNNHKAPEMLAFV
ncbi:cell division protease FtsH [Mesobacillus persicus]|uniref:Cell division protease FtsH n=1 Tax=Mesobacillus persicus TaxID=930146 RepID=A0A1H8EWX4_9BACI|nr:AAA family ATPase [Mesobacillus persicus]SEN23969.1 cell division protease FtsH [Mesobacillus persicus]